MNRSVNGIDRRAFLQGLPACLAGARPLPPVRALTRGPRFHWFGYYDHPQFDPADRYVLGMEVDFEDRVPAVNDRVGLGMIDLAGGDRWIPLGESRVFSWQQGCMLQWLPGSRTSVIYNDRDGEHLVARILDVHSRKQRTLPATVYGVSPDGRFALTTDFRRLRPETRYAAAPYPGDHLQAPPDSGIWRVDLLSGRTRLVLSFEEVLKVPYPYGDWSGYWHWLSHLLLSPDGRRFAFVHRWGIKGQSRIVGTRFFTADPDGRNLCYASMLRSASHFIWRDPGHVLVWALEASGQAGFYLYADRKDTVTRLAPEILTRNGHITYLRGNRWLLSDAYPDQDHNQPLYLFDVKTGTRVDLGQFNLPPRYAGPLRCDLHPRASRDGTEVVFDSPHAGNGRQMYLIGVRDIVTQAGMREERT